MTSQDNTRKVRQVRVFGQARLLGTDPPTSTQPYESDVSQECAICESVIPAGDLFTRALAPGYGRVRVNHCRACRPFEITQESIARSRGR